MRMWIKIWATLRKSLKDHSKLENLYKATGYPTSEEEILDVRLGFHIAKVYLESDFKHQFSRNRYQIPHSRYKRSEDLVSIRWKNQHYWNRKCTSQKNRELTQLLSFLNLSDQ